MRKGLNEQLAALNKTIEKFLPLCMPLSIIIGFAFHSVLVKLQPFVPELFAVMTLSGALKLKARDMLDTVRRPLPIIIFLVLSHVFMPLIVFAVCSVVFKGNPDILSGYILLFSTPVAVSSFIWTGMYAGDMALTLTIILLDTILAPLVVPGTVSLLLNTAISIDMSGIAFSLMLMVVIPTIIAVIINEASRGKIPAMVLPVLNPLSKICLSVVIMANTAAAAPDINIKDPVVLLIAFLCIVLGALAYLLALPAGKLCKFSAEKQKSLFFTVGLRNISATTTIAVQFFPPAAALPAILGIVFQQMMAAFMGKALLVRPRGGF
ncbi:MAG: bile acid:sodium symporter family protein [Spirochaetaceae bacterium]|nr:bile acid:sodium symporter family protein [Spirochaetaceae bacterium]